MKIRRLSFISLTLITLFLYSCGDSIEKKLIGEWSDFHKSRTYIFNQDGSCVLTLTVQKNTDQTSDLTFEQNWKVDSGKNPIHLDFIYFEKNNESGKESNYVSPYILRFLSEDKIQIRGPRTFDFKTGEILPKMRSTNFENDDYSNDGDDITSLIRQ